ncbi:hypothetical protein [Sphingobacterium zeae]|uniref:hypothetical protein n=1 Tax=Sphingobacterium zeae TaxID=1776859 RepID=UPI003621C49D
MPERNSGDHPKGALWFDIADVQLHVREEEMHHPHSDRHPAFEVARLAEAMEFLQKQQIEITYSTVIEGRERCFFRDPFGNRFELIEYKIR